MIIAIVERYGIIDSTKEAFFYRKEFKDIFEELNISLFPISSLTNIEKIIDICDGLIITGGSIDINPKFYNKESSENFNIIYDKDDELDFTLIKKFHEVGKPILGICRGIQSINVYFGGTLYEDIPNHNFNDKISTHTVILDKESLLYKCYNNDLLELNSFHHQAVDVVADDFKVVAISDDGTIEGIEYKNILGVQWHPEIMKDINFFKKFIEIYF